MASNLQNWIKKLPGLLTVGLVMVLGITLGNLFWLILTPAPGVAQAATLPSSELVKAPSQNYGQIIAAQHLFGAVPKANVPTIKKPPPVQVVKPKLPPLKLKLHGIMARESGDSFAMLSVGSGAQSVYGIDEKIPRKAPTLLTAEEAEQQQPAKEEEGAYIKSITETQVIVDNRGTLETLELTKLDKTKSSGGSATRTPARNNRSTQAAVHQARGTASLNGVNTSANGNVNNRRPRANQVQTLSELREKAMENPNVLLSVVTPTLVRENGEIKGVRVYPSRNRALFRQLGLRNGDVITSVNGIQIDSPTRGLEIMQQIVDSPSVTLNVNRGGNVQVLTPQL